MRASFRKLQLCETTRWFSTGTMLGTEIHLSASNYHKVTCTPPLTQQSSAQIPRMNFVVLHLGLSPNKFPTKVASYTIACGRPCQRSVQSTLAWTAVIILTDCSSFCSIFVPTGASPMQHCDLQFLFAATWVPCCSETWLLEKYNITQ